MVGRGLAYAWVILASVAALCAVGATVLVGVGFWIEADGRLLAREGAPITAEVLDRRTEQRRERNASGFWRTYTSYYVTVSYQPQTGDRIEREQAVGRDRYALMEEGASITVIHAPSRPEVFEFAAGERAGEGWVLKLAGFGLVVVALGAGLAARYVRRVALMVSGALDRGQAR